MRKKIRKKGSEWAVPAAICVRALQKSTFYATHLLFRGWHDVTGIRMKQFVHLYLPMSFRFAVKQKRKYNTHTSCHMEGKTCWKTKGWAKGETWNTNSSGVDDVVSLFDFGFLFLFFIIKLRERCPFTQHGTARPVGPAPVYKRETLFVLHKGWCLSEACSRTRRDQSQGGLFFFFFCPLI